MKSKISFFNRGLSASLLRRSWPVWTSYFVLLLIMVPGDMMQIVERSARYEQSTDYLFRQLNRTMLSAGVNVAILSFFVCVLVAMAMFGYMYNNRSCSMYNSLPIKRETVFSTAFLTGLVPMLIADVIIALICLALFSSQGLEAKNVWLYLSMSLMGNIAFYGMAAFCSVLTGHILILPAVYVILNVAAALAEAGIFTARDTIVYGYAGAYHLQPLSPIVQLAENLNLQTDWVRNADGGMVESGVYTVEGYEWLIIYCIAGLVLAALAVLIYRRRHMESCGDVVAISILKPIFRYCMCFGVALMFAYVVYNAIFSSYLSALPEAGCYLALMLAGAFMGYFAAEMLMQKTLRVFRGKWKGFIVSSLIIIAFVGINEFDLTGYEKRLPEADNIEKVYLSYHEGCEYEEPENIEKLLEFHRLIIDQKAVNESAYVDGRQHVGIIYTMKDGSEFSRNYFISYETEQKRNSGSCVNALAKVVNLQEAIDKRAATEVPVTEHVIVDASLEGRRLNEAGEFEWFSLPLTAAQAAQFYNECIVPDAAEGKLCRLFPVNTEEYYTQVSSVSFHFGLYYEDLSMREWGKTYKSFTMYLDAPRCCEWIDKNTDIELISLGEVDPEGMQYDLYSYGSTDVPTAEAVVYY